MKTNIKSSWELYRELTRRDERYSKLYVKAVEKMLDKTDFDPLDWLDEKDSKEFKELLATFKGGKFVPILSF